MERFQNLANKHLAENTNNLTEVPTYYIVTNGVKSKTGIEKWEVPALNPGQKVVEEKEKRVPKLPNYSEWTII